MTLADSAIKPVYGQDRGELPTAATPAGLLAARRRKRSCCFAGSASPSPVYGEGEKDGTERLIPFDIIPRMMLRSEWALLERGLVQQVKALNLFLADIYGAQEILKAERIPAGLVARNAEFRPGNGRLAGAARYLRPYRRHRCGPHRRRRFLRAPKTICVPRRGSPTCWKIARS